MLSSTFSKYRFLIVAIGLFLIFDLGVLVLNFYTSGRIAEQTELIDLAGRQRTLTQKMAKATLYIKAQKLQQWVYQSGLDELREHYTVFSSTMQAFNFGGDVRSARNVNRITIQAVDDVQAKRILSEANQLWARFEKVLDPMMIDTLVTDQEIQPASEFIANNNLKLFALMDQLTQRFAQESAHQTNLLRMAQVAGITLATLNFFIILIHFLGQLRSRERKLELAKHESDQILATVSEGVFLVNNNMRLGGQHSKHLQTIFANQNISGRKLERFLSAYFNKKTVNLAMEYVGLFFKPHVNADLIHDINPLLNVQATVPTKNGESVVKYLDFAFAKLEQDQAPPVVLVSVNDVTDRFLLQEHRQKKDQGLGNQLSVLSQLLPLAYEDSQVFIQESLVGYERLNRLLKNNADSGDSYHQMLDKMLFETHKLKGNAAVMGFSYICEQMHDFEDLLAELRRRETIQGEDLVPLAVELQQLFTSLDAVQQVRDQLVNFSPPKPKTASPEQAVPDEHRRWLRLQQFVKEQAAQANVQAELTLSGFDQPIEESVSASLYPMVVQLLRNSIAHGVERAEERVSLQKPAEAQLKCSLSCDAQGKYRLVYTDDGRGFDFDRIRQKLIELKRETPDEIAQMSHQDLIKRAFRKRLSTASTTTLSAGRGVGLSLVAELVNSLNGRLKVRSTRNEFTRFVVEFPAEKTEC